MRAGLRLEGVGQDDAEGSEAADSGSPKSAHIAGGCSYISAMLTYIAQVGDEVAAADPAPTEAQNYFAMLRERPPALLARLCAQWGAADGTAARVAALLGCDLVSSCLASFPHHLSLFAQLQPGLVMPCPGGHCREGMLQEGHDGRQPTTWGGPAP